MASVETEFKKNPELKQEHINIIKTWILKQPHLPQISDVLITTFLHCCKFKLEATKNVIDNYFTIRTIAPEIFANRDVRSIELCEALETLYIAKLPGQTPKGYYVMISKLKRTQPEHYVFADVAKVYNMHSDLLVRDNGSFPGIVYLIDMTGVSLGHIPKLNITALKHNFTYLQEALPMKLQSVHMINVVSFIDTIMNVMKPFMKPELQNMFHYHQANCENLYDFVPKAMLPKDYGGEAPCLAELHKETRKYLLDNERWFKEEELLRVDESKRLGKSKIATDEFDMNGSFKKLDID